MKKKILCVLALVSVISLAGCMNDEYSTERRYWKILKKAEAIFKNPDATPTAQMQKAVLSLNAFRKKFPKSNLSINADFTIANLYLAKKEFTEARAQVNKIIKEYSALPEIVGQAIFLNGNSYELEEKWEAALAQYKRVINEYPMTIAGLQSPVYIAQHYKVKFQPDKMIAAFQEAALHYINLASQADEGVAIKLYQLAAQCYTEIKEWQSVLSVFDTVIAKYKGKINIDLLLYDKIAVYAQQLKDRAKAEEIYKELVKDYPKSRFTDAAKKMLEAGKGK